jgi:hypothetical protein
MPPVPSVRQFFAGKILSPSPPVPPPFLQQLCLTRSLFRSNWPSHQYCDNLLPSLTAVSFRDFQLYLERNVENITSFAPRLKMVNFVTEQDSVSQQIGACTSVVVLGLPFKALTTETRYALPSSVRHLLIHSDRNKLRRAKNHGNEMDALLRAFAEEWKGIRHLDVLLLAEAGDRWRSGYIARSSQRDSRGRSSSWVRARLPQTVSWGMGSLAH